MNLEVVRNYQKYNFSFLEKPHAYYGKFQKISLRNQILSYTIF